MWQAIRVLIPSSIQLLLQAAVVEDPVVDPAWRGVPAVAAAAKTLAVRVLVREVLARPDRAQMVVQETVSTTVAVAVVVA